MKKIILLLTGRKQRMREPYPMSEELQDLRERGREQFQKLANMGLRVSIAL